MQRQTVEQPGGDRGGFWFDWQGRVSGLTLRFIENRMIPDGLKPRVTQHGLQLLNYAEREIRRGGPTGSTTKAPGLLLDRSDPIDTPITSLYRHQNITAG